MNKPVDPGKDEFDAKAFLAKVGTGKTILNFRKNQIVFNQGEAADTVFYIQKGKIKLTVLSEQGKEAVVAIWSPPVLRRRLHERSQVTHFDDDGHGRLCHHCHHQTGDDKSYS